MIEDLPHPPTLPARRPDSDPGRIEHQVSPPCTYYVAADGERWRVIDCIMTGGYLRRTSLESARASCRVFLSRTGLKRLCGRQQNEVWTLSPQVCQRQLGRSSVVKEGFADDDEIAW